MKTNIFYFCMLIGIFATNCKSKKVVSESNKSNTAEQSATVDKKEDPQQFKVKIIRKSCASLVAGIMDEKYQSLGEEWVPFNVRMKEPYKFAVNISNKCEIPDEIEAEDIIIVKIAGENDKAKTECIACMMMDYPPAKNITVKYLGRAPREKN